MDGLIHLIDQNVRNRYIFKALLQVLQSLSASHCNCL
jgi:hypothetical protein